MRLLITGASGFLGSHLVKKLLLDGHQVVIIKRKTSDLYRLKDCLNRIDLFNSDVNLDSIFDSRKIDGVIHLAVCYGRNDESVAKIFETNTVFSLKLLEAAVAAEVGIFIHSDTSLDKYLNPYSISKRQFSEWGEWIAKRGHINFLNIRLEHMYGINDDPSKFTSFVVQSLLKNIVKIDLTKGEQLRDFIYIDDVVSAFQILLNSMVEKNKAGFVECDLGSGEAVQIRDFVEMVHKITGSKTVLNFGALPYRSGEVMQTHADLTYLKSLGWNAAIKLSDGLQKIIENEKK